MEIILKVQSAGSNLWRLGLNTKDSVEKFQHGENVKFILSTELVIYCNVACGTSKKRTFDFNKNELSKWIVCNKYHIYPSLSPTKLTFKLTSENNDKCLTFLTKYDKNLFKLT